MAKRKWTIDRLTENERGAMFWQSETMTTKEKPGRAVEDLTEHATIEP
ncbi:MAG: hypothetical protein QME60_05210 [Verrucomicrobiota bacterium]|nr:hypothetical protein [Verrucomicrobiota bacterium]